jgi:hypothetical protein
MGSATALESDHDDIRYNRPPPPGDYYAARGA